MRLIGIAGPSCSGKSTIAKELGKRKEALVISMDRYFKDSKEWSGHWETPEAINIEEFYRDLRLIRKDQETTIPKYQMRYMRRTGTERVKPRESNIFEGFLLFTDKRIRDCLDIKIYVDITPEEQLKRRKARQPDLDETYFWEKIVSEYERYGLPTRQYADHIIDGSQAIQSIQSEIGLLLSR